MADIKVLLVDDHEVVRKGMSFLLEDEPSLEIVGEASGGKEALEKIPELKPNLILLDINMPEMNGIETAAIISKRFPKIKVLIFSMHNDPDYILKSIESKVDGYILKDADKEEIVKAMHVVHNGEKYFPPEVSAILVSAMQSNAGIKPMHSNQKVLGVLSKKEVEVLKFIADGKSSKDIAEKLGLSIRTVSNHRANMLKKTNLNNTAELVRIASTEGL
ncbi:response regulator transcription factor [Arcticibacterium luteifluviistationis]|uniref:DNA-binding response regulator n=1 Tax=Arcticibacterium luteifluviistationis TaxID=1784714 RepID=A0A2Z4GEJ4_9BACT|nr:response regulator transcription factor [Arcticibacterium luteifluviistationis]AWV99537.1 DNA-binding response regulator [Arcticibacterium luteifluviistationis]